MTTNVRYNSNTAAAINNNYKSYTFTALITIALYPLISKFVPALNEFISSIHQYYYGTLVRVAKHFLSLTQVNEPGWGVVVLGGIIYAVCMLVSHLTTALSLGSFSILAIDTNLATQLVFSFALAAVPFVYVQYLGSKKNTSRRIINVLLLQAPFLVISLPLMAANWFIQKVISNHRLNKKVREQRMKDFDEAVNEMHRNPKYNNQSNGASPNYSNANNKKTPPINNAPRKPRDIVEIDNRPNKATFINKEVKHSTMPDTQSSETAVSSNTSDRAHTSTSDYSSVDAIIDKHLSGIVGIDDIREQIRRIIISVTYHDVRQLAGVNKKRHLNLHTMLTGNPGTGKTTIARALGKIYHEAGLLPTANFVEIGRDKIVGEFIGQTDKLIAEHIEKAMGGILFIDEAYALAKQDSGKDFGHDAIAALVRAMENHRDDFIVIVAGYKDKMHEFLSSNPGLNDRLKKKIDIPDFDTEKLCKIFESFCNSEEYYLTDESRKAAYVEIDKLYRSRTSDFGNARAVRNLFDEIVERTSLRVVTYNITDPVGVSTILPVDIKQETSDDSSAYIAEFDKMIGLDDVKSKALRFINNIKVGQEKHEAGFNPLKPTLNLVMTGNPGTGKTTMAEILANAFHKAGVLNTNKITYASRSEIIGQHIGDTEKNMKKKIEQSLGGMLFIDEAYSLVEENSSNDYGKKALEVLLEYTEKYRENLMVVVAGYPDKMQKFVDANPGLKSRFPHQLHFRDYNVEELVEIFIQMSNKEGYKLEDGAREAVTQKIECLYELRDENFGNARTIRNFLDEVKMTQSDRLIKLSKEERKGLIDKLTKEDIVTTQITTF